ncbi:hypothetical protein [Paenibacillus harenae]|uniref:Uncharacterized protein n=1 Tax=Paenibacillus harenae TaxID=306543 RepID=A0ABT9U0E3_PAEHA|nr:hypothetical protein [Paenibacillus harenae]MDQ0060000.1 hypothetical protein [Paenibacillus harenae]MDQ0112448.1 hypothetical protein [Paenibacillus harenae]
MTKSEDQKIKNIFLNKSNFSELINQKTITRSEVLNNGAIEIHFEDDTSITIIGGEGLYYKSDGVTR